MNELNKNIETDENVRPVWKCTVCGKENIGNFCTQCGTRKPVISVTPVMPLNTETAETVPSERTITDAVSEAEEISSEKPAAETVIETAAETIEAVEEKAAEAIETAEVKTAETIETADEKAEEVIEAAEVKTAETVEAAVEKTAETIEAADEKAEEVIEAAEEKTAEIIETAEETAASIEGTASPAEEETIEKAAAPEPEHEDNTVREEAREEEKVIPAQFTETHEAPVREVQTSKKHTNPLLNALLAALLGVAGGFGGGYLAFKKFADNNSVSVQEVPAETAQAEEAAASALPEPTAQTVAANTGSDSSETSLTIQEIAAKAAPSVVEIVVETETQSFGMFGGSYIAEAAGSGVIISEDGYIITNNHVVEDSTFISVTLYDGTVYEANLVGTDSKGDIAVIKIEAEGLKAAVIGDSDDIQVGDLAVAIGNPLGTLGGTVTDGIISAKDREITLNNETMNLLQTNAAINNGNSGGGLFDSQGNLIGIVNAKDSGLTSSGSTIEGLGFAIPINDAMKIANDLMTNGVVTNRPYIGISLQTVTQSSGQYEAGLYIVGVVEGSGADEAGLQYGDRIISADGKEISTYTELSAVLLKKEIGDTLNLTIVRENEQMDVSVVLTEVITDGSVKEEGRP